MKSWESRAACAATPTTPQLLRAAAAAAAARGRARAVGGPQGGAALRRRRRGAEPRPRSLRELDAAIRDADAVLFSHAGVQPLDPRPAQERAGLALAPAGREPAAQQAGRRGRRQHGPVRRRLGAGRAAQGARPRSAPGWSTASCPSGQAADAFTEDGRLADDDLELVLADLLAELVGARPRRRSPKPPSRTGRRAWPCVPRPRRRARGPAPGRRWTKRAAVWPRVAGAGTLGR